MTTPLNPRVKLVIIRDFLLPYPNCQEQIFYPTTITPELKHEFPYGVVEMSSDVRSHYNKWFNDAIAQMDPSATSITVVGCDMEFNRDESLSFYIELEEN